MASSSTKPDRLVQDRPLSDSESDDSRDEEGWNDVEEDEETQEVISLLDDRVFPDVISMLAYCKDKHNFDFLGVRQRLQLDFHGCVRLVNFSKAIPSCSVKGASRTTFHYSSWNVEHDTEVMRCLARLVLPPT